MHTPRKSLGHEALQYALVGGVCTALDMGVLYLLATVPGTGYLLASIASFMTGATLNYVLCTTWIFEYRRIRQREREFVWYLAITGIVLAVNTLLMYVFTDGLGMHFMASKLVAIGVTYVLNFGLRKTLLHTEKVR